MADARLADRPAPMIAALHPGAPDLAVLIHAAHAAIADHAGELDRLDAAIGDGDHGTNMRRGFAALQVAAEDVAALPQAEALQEAGRILLMTIGGASGPLAATLLMALGRALSVRPASEAWREAVAAVAARGRASPGDKTVIDVLTPVAAALETGAAAASIARIADAACAATRPMQARRGRAAALGVRSIGHIDPGARSAALLAQVWAKWAAKQP
ncbi:MAG: dihydroxyacetone kinase subunit DhaL [Rhizobiaceae bacterium]|jgi:dihydroxyacetone kinase-like protein|nr:dihydroxyacetone kinase subunit DhaL [Rhizobiaceae bacterium]